MMKDLFDPLKKVKENESCRVRKEKESEIQRAKFLKLIKNGNTEFKEEEEEEKNKVKFSCKQKARSFFSSFSYIFSSYASKRFLQPRVKKKRKKSKKEKKGIIKTRLNFN